MIETNAFSNLLLIGFMGTGKSSVGRLLARELGYRFADTDSLIARNAGKPIPAIFSEQGESAFRDLETATLRSLSTSRHRVIATGGGIIEREDNRPLLREIGLVICLTASEEIIFQRVSRNNRRPLLQNADPRGTIHRLLTARQPIYKASAHFQIDTSELNHAEVAATILSTAKASGITLHSAPLPRSKQQES